VDRKAEGRKEEGRGEEGRGREAFIQHTAAKITFVNADDCGRKLVVIYTGTCEVWCTALG